MATIDVSSDAEVNAPPDVVYRIIADYENGHPRILPQKYFAGLVVEEGGVGAGTRIRFTMKGMGQARTMRARVEEPEPGRVLLETDLQTGAKTTFTVEPIDGGHRSRVTIRTEWQPRGIGGLFERMFAPRLLRDAYAQELTNLHLVASTE